MVVASFHLTRYPARAALRRMAMVPVDRRALRRIPGLRFGRLLGTGAGMRMTTSIDPARWALFGVWDDEDALDHFRSRHRLGRGFVEDAAESFHVVLAPESGHGSWDGFDPLPTAGTDGSPTEDGASRRPGPVAVLTRATVRLGAWRTFAAAVPAVDVDLAGQDGLLAAVGVGEVPIGRQATFSLWRDTEALEGFAHRTPAHAEVVRRTRDEDWYGEELFARFRPLRWSGTWDGRRPLG